MASQQKTNALSISAAKAKGKGGKEKSTDEAVSKSANASRSVQKIANPAASGTVVSGQIDVPGTVKRARFRGRHKWLIASFIAFVFVPSALVAYYLWDRAADQYASKVGFSVRTEEVGSAIDSIVGITQLSGSSSSDTDILYEYLHSQELVSDIDAELDLRSIWAKGDPNVDFWFSYDAPGTIEDLLEHWSRKVKVYYDTNSGLIDLRVLAFDPDDAKKISSTIYAKSVERINELSAIAREDAIRYARDELQQAEDRLRNARVALLEFRNRTQLIDPSLQNQTQSGLIAALEAQLAEAQIERLLLLETTREGDPRITQVELKIDVIQRQISEERAKIGVDTNSSDANSVADLIGEYEALSVDLEFAQQAYTASRAAFDTARNEARRQSRYLAAHVNPTRAEQALYPQRFLLWSLVTLFIFMTWSIATLVAYALKDRR